MAVIRPPALVPVLASTAGAVPSCRAVGLDDPSLLPRHRTGASECFARSSAWLAAYRACIGLPDDPHLPPLALQTRGGATCTWPFSATRSFRFERWGMVHLTQRVDPDPAAWRPHACFDLRAFCADARWEKRGMSFALVTEARWGGELVWRGETRALAPGKTPAAVTAPTADAPAEPADVADSEQVLRVPESTGRRYAAIAGDLNPIHQHALLARLFGFRRAIVHGTWTLARALAVAGTAAGSPAFALDARFPATGGTAVRRPSCGSGARGAQMR
jgi:hypothetical protein